MLRLIRRFFTTEHGQAVAELAVALPVLLMILCGIIDFGWIFGNQLTLSYCCREGARYGIVNFEGINAEQDIKDRIFIIAPEYIRDKLTATVAFSDESSRRDGDLSVNVTADVDALTPIAGIFTQGQTVSISSRCVMKVE